MAGVTPNEGETVLLNLLYKNADVNRGSTLELGLFTNSSGLSETSVLANITEPTGAGGYARITLADASWTVSGTTEATYAIQSFTASGAAYSADIYGYFIATTGTTPKLLHFEVNGAGATTIADGDTYQVDLSVTGD
ncbi:MAG: hypothetical protein GY776_00355 [Alteromonas sp.]|nr:hypothetical protein [Alteromonas sp.]